MYTVSVIVPAYNEEKTIETSLMRLLEQLNFKQILVVNDGSTDSTLQIVSRLSKVDSRIIIINNPINKGKGYALSLTKAYINSDFVVIHDADLEYNPIDLKAAFELLEKGKMILGSRFIGKKKRSNLYKRTILANKIMSKFFSFVNSINITDIATCYKLMPSDYFKNTHFVEEGFSIEIEIVSKFLKISNNIIEIPISYNGRSYEEGKKIKTKDGFLYLKNILKYKFLK